MKITTQDGRTLELNRDYFLDVWTINRDCPTTVVVTLESEPVKVASSIRYYTDGHWRENPSFYWRHNVILREIIGKYATATSRQKVAELLQTAWQTGATEFTAPQDTLDKSAAEKFNDFCEKHHLTLATAEETAIGLSGSEKSDAIHLARDTDYWERRNVLIADERGDYTASLAKWRNIA